MLSSWINNKGKYINYKGNKERKCMQCQGRKFQFPGRVDIIQRIVFCKVGKNLFILTLQIA